jgi:EAL domain-containing protein (putative c-di-GMP-specific phosphodiesterase class I)
MTAHSLRRVTFEGLLRRALDRGEFRVHYQPQLDLNNSSTCGMEALIRWDCPDVGIVSPVEFIPIAEETGLILPIGEWVLREACRQAQEWRNEGLPIRTIAVNVAMLQFMQREFAGLVALTLTEIGLPASCLELEITESMLFTDESASVQAIESLRAVGVGISIDDFGTGYSSLSRLKHFRVNRLKIDRSFITGIPMREDDVAITTAIIGMARTLGLKVVAEGIEEAAQIDFLRKQKCDEAQGYLLSPPLPPDEARQFLIDLHDATVRRKVLQA